MWAYRAGEDRSEHTNSGLTPTHGHAETCVNTPLNRRGPLSARKPSVMYVMYVTYVMYVMQ